MAGTSAVRMCSVWMFQVLLVLIVGYAVPTASVLRGGYVAIFDQQEEEQHPEMAHRRLQEDPLGGSYEYVGCYNDNEDDPALHSRLASSKMTTMMCHTHCDAKGAAYMATQFGNQCWCQKDPREDLYRHGVGICDTACTGDDTETCGGIFAFDLYKMEWAPEPDDEEYVGCFGDDTNNRVMGDMIVQDDMSPEVCREHCLSTSAKYYATQYGNECFCGISSDESDYKVYGTGICHMRCTGDDSVSCGGYEAFNLFRFDQGSSSSSTSTTVTSTTSSSSTTTTTSLPGDDAGEYENLLSLHNKNRCMHNADPLAWDSDIFNTAKEYASFLTNDDNCGVIFHSDGPYGENLYICSSTGGYGCYSDEAAMKRLFDDELIDPSDVTTYEGHATAILWKSTERIGCAVAQCEKDGWYSHTLVCNFDPPGNNMNNLIEEVEPPSGKDPSTCGF